MSQMTDILEELKAAKDAAANRELASLLERAEAEIADLRRQCGVLLEERQDAQLRLNAYLKGHLTVV